MNHITSDSVIPHFNPKAEERMHLRLAEWDAKTRMGLVGIQRFDAQEWARCGRGWYVEKWVTEESWLAYLSALALLEIAEAGLG